MKKYKINKRSLLGLVLMLLAIGFSALPTEGAVNADYCITPPFLLQTIQPNVLIVLDNSGSMNAQAYAGSFDPSLYSQGYYGLYDPAQNYVYSSNGRWEPTTADPAIFATTANPIASGNFLNWATMRRVDVSKKLLIGGRAVPRSPAGAVTVKLYGENSPTSWNFSKDFNNSTVGWIWPFTGNYRYSMSGDTLRVTPLVADTDTENVYPKSNVSVPAAWTVAGVASAWDAVNEVAADGDTTYIQNSSTNNNDQVILGYSPYAPTIAGTIQSVTVVVRARKAGTSTGQTRRIEGVLRMKSAGVDVDYFSNYSNLSTFYSNYSFSWTTNPQTGLAWQWTDLTGAGVGSLSGFGVSAYTNPTASNYYRVTQVYLIVTVSTPTGGPYSIIVDQGMQKAEGIIDHLSADVRFGLAFYNTSEGAGIENYVDFGSAVNMVTTIQNMSPSTWTPLGETLHEMTRYFRQDAPYYAQAPADYQTGLNYDPYYYQYSKLAGSGMSDQYVPCAKSFVLFLTDGESTQDQNIPGNATSPPYAACSLTNIKACSGNIQGVVTNPRIAGTAVGQTYASFGTDYLIDVAYWMRTNDMRPGACTTVPTAFSQCIPGTQNMVLYSVFMFGRGSTLLKDAAIYGGFNDLNSNNKPDCSTSPRECYRDSDGDGVVESNGQDDPLTYFEGDDGYELQNSITNAITDILKRAASGTATSILSSSEGSGATILQAIFYPKKIFSAASEVTWTGEIQNMWYYLDPRLQSSRVREDTVNDYVLNLSNDYIVESFFDTSSNQTKVNRYSDTNGDGSPDALIDTVSLEGINSLWKAGSKLWSRDLSIYPRTIYTTLDRTSLTSFLTLDTANATVQSLLQVANSTEAAKLINYIHGIDQTGYRTRSATISGASNIWKLGDIISSTPKVQSSVPLNLYYNTYNDKIYRDYSSTSSYLSRGMAYVGANDGMLHALKFGKFEVSWSGQNKTLEKVRLTDTTDIGKEMWAYIPKSALPYLKYLTDPNYCHLYYVDASPYIFDASINSPLACTSSNYWECDKTVESWRTILIGGMRLGGGCKEPASSSTLGVNTPLAGEGYSSYFALDVTDPASPILLWEFTNPALGFTTSGPAIVRINARELNADSSASIPNKNKNGRWFVVLASGPTGPIEAQKFKGYSDQSLKLFILDLKSGSLLRTIDTADASLPAADRINYAFGGSLNNVNIDFDFDYQDDALYLGYTKSETGTTTANWTGGGVIRLVTREDLSGTDITSGGTTALNPNNWSWSHVMKDTGSVTTAVSHLAHYKSRSTKPDEAWLYFGTGRYFFKDDDITQRQLFGIKDPCLRDPSLVIPLASCSVDAASQFCLECVGSSYDPKPVSGLSDKTCSGLTGAALTACLDASVSTGWFITLDSPPAERVITDPLATPTGTVFYTTFAPSADVCDFGGSTYLWAVNYKTGGAVGSYLHGTALIQVSTGAIEEVNLETAFTEEGGRRSTAIQGVPPSGQGLALIVPPKAINRVLHIRKQ
ncbi:MAG: hypothetical protein AB1632_05105 [Nitrospirota bacterium]